MDQLAHGSLTWHKSSRSNANGNCVEVANAASESIAVRDSKRIPPVPFWSFRLQPGGPS